MIKAAVQCRKWHCLVKTCSLFLPEILCINPNCGQALVNVENVGGGAAASSVEGREGSAEAGRRWRLSVWFYTCLRGELVALHIVLSSFQGLEQLEVKAEGKKMKRSTFIKLIFTLQIHPQEPKQWGCEKADQTQNIPLVLVSVMVLFFFFFFLLSILILVHLVPCSSGHYYTDFQPGNSCSALTICLTLVPLSQTFCSPTQGAVLGFLLLW